jgi:hypothetical protein
MINGWTVHHLDPDDGDVRLVSPGGQAVTVPFDVLAEVVGAAMRDVRAEDLARLTGQQYLTMMAAP